MLSDSFRRLPESLRKTVLDGIDAEISRGFELIEGAERNTDTDPETSRQLADGIVRSRKLRDAFTGEQSA